MLKIAVLSFDESGSSDEAQRGARSFLSRIDAELQIERSQKATRLMLSVIARTSRPRTR